MDSFPDLTIVGGGLAGCEAAWQAAQRGLRVHLKEMRPLLTTGAHQTSNLAELICSNSLGSNLPDRASGILKNELRRLNSLLMECADEAALPAGSALAVDRDIFALRVTERISSHPNIEIIRQEVTEIPSGLVIIASGPLTSEKMANAITLFTSKRQLHFYDALAPIVTFESINMDIAFRASRYKKGERDEGDYINCPFTEEQYDIFVDALCSAERIELHEFEIDIEKGVNAGDHQFFEGCLPVEVIARRGHNSLAFGPMRPVGLTDPHTSERPYALVQLRQDNLAGSLYNLVGFQTNLTFQEQKRVLCLIPGLENADFIRFGQMHRNTFIASPTILLPTLQARSRANLFFAGQITGVEGYMGNIATGLLAGWNAARFQRGEKLLKFPHTTMLGALCHYITNASQTDFQPMKANLGILPSLESDIRLGKRERAKAYAVRASEDLDKFICEI